MADLGTLWFNVDLKLDELKRKIQEGNQDVLNALKIDYDPQSYAQMVSKLRSQLEKETFEIKLKANTQGVVQDIQNAAKGGFSGGSMSGLDAFSQKILDQRKAVNELSASVATLKAELDKMGGSPRPYLDEVAKYEKAKAELQNLLDTQKAYDKATKRTTQAKQEASSAAKKLSSDHIRLNATLFNGVHLSTQLGSALSSLFALHTARQFLGNVIEIGGQLEKQRISMGAIIGDLSRANELFENIKNLAVKSPFGVVELDQYSKQLAAYGIEQSELFNMTKRLADISAGAGQDIGRLALALGHVKSATYLTGITLRQFSMNNIPMLKMLADYYSEVEKRAVSTAEVQKRISQRQVSYEDVITQIKRMTDEGGQFYNMQEKISESLSARFKNLKDSFDIMYGEIAESNIGDMLKSFAEGATEMSRNWKSVATVLAVAALQFGVTRIATLANNQAIVANTNAVGKLAFMSRNLTAEKVKELVVEKQLQKEHLLNAVAMGRLTVAEAKGAAAIYGVTTAQLEQIATSKKVDAGLVRNALSTSRYSVAQLRMIASMKLANANISIFGYRLKWVEGMMLRLRIAGIGMANAFKVAFASVAGFIPQLATFTAISLAIDTIAEGSRKAEEQERRLAEITEKANEGYKNMSEVRSKYGVGSSVGMSDDDLSLAIPDLVEQLKNYSEISKKAFNNAFAVDKEGKAIHSLSEQYEILAKAVDDTTEAYKAFNELKPMIEHALEVNMPDEGFFKRLGNKLYSWILPDADKSSMRDLSESLEFYAKSVKEANVAEELFLRNRLDVQSALASVGYSEAIDMDNESLLQLINTMRRDAPDSFRAFYQMLDNDGKNALNNMTRSWNTMDSAFMEANLRMRKAGEDLYQTFRTTYGEDMQQWPSYWEDVVHLVMNNATKDVKGFADMSIEYQNMVRNSFLHPFKIEVDSEEAQQQVNNLLVELQNLVGTKWVATIGVKGESSIQDVESATDAYSKALKNVESTRKRLRKLKKQGDTSSEAYKKTLQDLVHSQNAAEAAKETILHYGGDLPELNGKGSGGGRGGSKSDEKLKEARRLLEEAQSFYQEYEDYKRLVGKEKAISLLEELFPSTKGRGKDIAENYKQVLTDIKNSIPLDSEERKKFGLSIDKLIADYDKKGLQETADRALSELDEYISKQSERHSIFKSIFEKTGDENLAMKAFSDGRVWDAAARKFEERLKEVVGGADVDYFMTDAAAKEYFKDLPDGYKLWKKIVDLTSKNYVDGLKKSADATAAMMSLQEKIANNQRQIDELRSKDDGTDHTAEIAQLEQETAKLRGELLSISPEFKELFKDVTDMSIRQIQRLYEKAKALKTLIDTNRTKSVQNQNGEVIGYEYKDENEEPAYISLDDYERLEKQLGKLQKKVPALSTSFKRLWDFITGKDGDNDGKADLTFKDIAQDLANVMDAVRGTTDALGEMFDALGDEDMADGFALVGDMLGAGSDIAKGIASGNPLDVINGIAKGITSIAQHHDKKLDKAIERSERRVKKLQNAYKNLEWEIGHQLTAITQKQSAEMLANLQEQERELEGQLADEKKKKKTDAGKVIDLTQEIEEAKKQIATFYEELGKERYGLDLDAWAGDLASAIVDAFIAGEDAAEAFDKKVADIMKDVVSQIIKIRVIKPAMEDLEKFLFGNEGIATANSEGGVEITPQEAARLVGQFADLKDKVDNGKNIYDIINQAMQSMGIDWGENESKSTSTSSSIKSITEDTANLLASYINAIRADVSVMREEQTANLATITVAVERTNVLAESQVMLQQQIADNTLRNANAAEAIENILSRASTTKGFGFYVQ